MAGLAVWVSSWGILCISWLQLTVSYQFFCPASYLPNTPLFLLLPIFNAFSYFLFPTGFLLIVKSHLLLHGLFWICDLPLTESLHLIGLWCHDRSHPASLVPSWIALVMFLILSAGMTTFLWFSFLLWFHWPMLCRAQHFIVDWCRFSRQLPLIWWTCGPSRISWGWCQKIRRVLSGSAISAKHCFSPSLVHQSLLPGLIGFFISVHYCILIFVGVTQQLGLHVAWGTLFNG